MPRQSHILVLAALGLVALVAGGVWWIAEPRDAPSAAIEPAPVEPEARGEQEPITAADLSDAAPEGRELVAIDAPPDGEPQAAIADDVASRPAIAKGLLVDAATNEPLPDYAFEMIDSRRKRVSLLTDAEGRFETALQSGPLRARFSEQPDRESIDAGELRFGADGEPEPLVLRVASGPTYRLAISPRDVVAPEMLRARLRLRVGEEDSSANGRVRDGPVPWTRLGPLAAEVGSPATLFIESVDGALRGSATVAMGPGIRPEVVPVVLQAFGALEVHIVDPDGRPVPGVSVELHLESGERGPQSTRSNNEGRAQFRFLASGAWNLVTRVARFEDWRGPVVLPPGELTRQEVQLVRAPSAGAIRGIVLSDTGRYRERVFVNLAELDREGSPGPIATRVEWTETTGIATGHFEILDVPPGRWRLSVSENDWFVWEPRRVEIEPPLQGVELRVHDAVPVVNLVYRPHAESGAPFKGRYELRVTNGSGTDIKSGLEGEALVPSFPVEQPLRWRIDAPECAPAMGDWSAFVTESPVDGRERRAARPVMLLGWGEFYRVTRSDNRRAVEGAAVLVDGREMGKTDKDGRVHVRTAAKPKSVTFRYRDWKLDRKVDLNPPRNQDLERAVRLVVPKPKAKK